MSASYQGCLFDPVSVHGGPPSLARLRETVGRHELAADAWVDVRRHWIAGADEVFAALARRVPWRPEEGTARLGHEYGDADSPPHRILGSARQALSNHYLAETGVPFASIQCSYQDGRNVAPWRRWAQADGQPLLAMVSLGDPCRLLVRPRGGGASVGFPLGHGDLVVLGGAGVHRWEHAVRRVAHTGARIAVEFRLEVPKTPVEADSVRDRD